jgi:hypothetical protein
VGATTGPAVFGQSVNLLGDGGGDEHFPQTRPQIYSIYNVERYYDEGYFHGY